MIAYIDTKETGERIKTLRTGKGFTVLRMSELLNVTFQAIYKWEAGLVLPDIMNLVFLSAVLDTSIDDILAIHTDSPLGSIVAGGSPNQPHEC